MEVRSPTASNELAEPKFSLPSFPEGRYKHEKISLITWISAVRSLFVHCILSVGITLFVLVYIHLRPFNVEDRIASVRTIGGSIDLPFRITQSDVVTILSSLLVIQGLALTAWVAKVYWPIAIFLMEKHGLRRRDFDILTDYQVVMPWISVSLPMVIFGTLLWANLAAGLTSPILTGSITWVSRNVPISGLSTGLIPLAETRVEPSMNMSSSYYGSAPGRSAYIQKSTGLIGTGWGRDHDKGISKRVERSIEALAINTTIESATLPYFVTHSINWIKNKGDVPTYILTNQSRSVFAFLNSTPATTSVFGLGAGLLLPNDTSRAIWLNDPLEPTIITDTRLLLFYFGHQEIGNITNSFPPDTYIHAPLSIPFATYFALAWVTFSAGVGRCKEHQCIISSPSTIQNATPIELEPHYLTYQALSFAPVIATSLVFQNISIPHLWDDVSDYVEAVLVRSYSGAWNALNAAQVIRPVGFEEDFFNNFHNASYHPALDSLIAHVDHHRVYAWLAIQLSVTLLGIICLFFQSNLSKIPLVGDPTMTTFYLGTKDRGILKVQEENDRLNVRLE